MPGDGGRVTADRQIPGITVPWAHVPTIALALLLNQLIHELGHALSGSLYVSLIARSARTAWLILQGRCPDEQVLFQPSRSYAQRNRHIPYRCGVITIVRLTHAVTMSTADAERRGAKLRLAASGPLHNFMVYITIALSVSTGFSHLFWANHAREGVVVQSVLPVSPRPSLLTPGVLRADAFIAVVSPLQSRPTWISDHPHR